MKTPESPATVQAAAMLTPPSIHSPPPQGAEERIGWELHMLSRLRRYLQRQLRAKEAALLALIADSGSVSKAAVDAFHCSPLPCMSCPADAFG